MDRWWLKEFTFCRGVMCVHSLKTQIILKDSDEKASVSWTSLSLSLPRSNHSAHFQQFTLVFAFSISKYVCSGFSWFIHSRHVLIFSYGRWSVISALLARLSSTNLPDRWLKSLFRVFTIRTGNISCSSKLSAVVAFSFCKPFWFYFY